MNNKKTFRKAAISTMAASAAVAAIAPAASAAETTSFPDVTKESVPAHYDNIMKLVEQDVIQGYEDGRFYPWKSISRGQIAAMLTKSLDLKVPEDLGAALKDYKDVSATSDYAEQIAAVTQAGIFKGNEQGNFNTFAPISREQMATVLVEGFGLNDHEAEKVNVKLSNVSPSHRDNVQKIADLGITKPQGDANEFNPAKQVTRAQFSTFLVLTQDIVAPQIVSLENPADVTIDKGAELTLPETVKATYDNETTADVAVEWDTSKVDASTVGSYTATGSVEGTEKTVTVNVTVRATEVTVESVKAINAAEIEVTFNTDVDKATAEDAGNYYVEKNTSPTTPVAIKDVKVTGNKALIRLDHANGEVLNPSDKYVVGAKDAIRSTGGLKLEKYSTPTMVFGDVTAPKLEKSVLGDNGDTLQLTFDKPVKSGITLAKVDGVSLGDTTLTQLGDDEAGNYTYTVDVTAAEKATVAKQGNHELTLFDVAETSTVNPAVASVLNASYAVNDKNVSAPEVKSVHALNGNKFFVEFNKGATLSDVASLEVKKGNHTFTTVAVDGTVPSDSSSVYAEKSTLNGKPGYYVVVTDAASGDQNPLYAKGEDSAKLDITVKNYKDSDGMIGSQYSGSVTLNKAADKPVIDKTTLNTTSNALYLDFEEGIESTDAIADTDVVVRNKEGVVVPDSEYALSITDTPGTPVLTNGRLAVTFTTADYAKDNAPFTVEVKADKFQYEAQTGSVINYQVAGAKNDKLSATVKATDQDNFKYVEFAGTVTPTNDNVITVDYAQDMEASAIDKANYQLDGKALPEGTTVEFYGDKQNVRITLPEETVKQDSKYKLTISNSVKTKEGLYVVNNTVEQKSYEELIDLKDNVSPELEGKAVYLVNAQDDTQTKTVKLTFSENVTASVNAENNFKVVINGTEQEVSSVAAGTGTEGNELVMTLKDVVNVNQAATITVVKDNTDKINITDTSVNNNVLVEGGKANITSNSKEVDAANATDLDAAANTQAVADAKTAVEGATYGSVGNAELNTASEAKTYVEGIINSLDLKGASYEVTQTGFTAADPGVADGSYKFTVNLTKGDAQDTTTEQTLAITQ
ncbi:S-layer homology domain-containing protein [Virgibacillus halodenitrificans]|uniref:S-layer homology domain-containing protein n=1 Tax=Virgibacillus halodenitrificans TaxID=1482 RepID=UPI000EF4CE2F|nr:S-layer homology domain-containing protein [Virgibacillus halodenitrificans]